MNEYYRQGFMDKCAELNIDPDRLIKLAARGDRFIPYLKKMVDSAKGRTPGRSQVEAKNTLDHIMDMPTTMASKGERAKHLAKHKNSGGYISSLHKKIVGNGTNVTSDTTQQMKDMLEESRRARASDDYFALHRTHKARVENLTKPKPEKSITLRPAKEGE